MAETPDDHDKRHVRRSGKVLLEWGVLLVGAVVVALLIRSFLFQTFYIPSDSMVPTLQTDDRVIVNKVSYRMHDVNRGDIVVFDAPESQPQHDHLVKRVIGLPGETLELRDGNVFVDGKRLREDYLPDGTLTQPICGSGATHRVPAGEFFMMGDNRTQSEDSRCFGTVPEDDIVGRVFVRVWPLTRLDFL